MATVRVGQNSSAEMGEPARKTNISDILDQADLYGSVITEEPLLKEKLYSRHFNDSESMRGKKIL